MFVLKKVKSNVKRLGNEALGLNKLVIMQGREIAFLGQEVDNLKASLSTCLSTIQTLSKENIELKNDKNNAFKLIQSIKSEVHDLKASFNEGLSRVQVLSEENIELRREKDAANKLIQTMKSEVHGLKTSFNEGFRKAQALSEENIELRREKNFQALKKNPPVSEKKTHEREKLVVKCFKMSDFDDKNVVEECFEKMLSDDAEEAMSNILHQKLISRNGDVGVFEVSMKANAAKKVVTILTRNKPRENEFSIRNYLSFNTRRKKMLLGNICKRIYEKPGIDETATACVPRFQFIPKLYFQKDYKSERALLSFEEAIKTFQELLTDEEIRMAQHLSSS